ncbi:MAG: bifunctional 5,10-methylenetetrahydrofolate dehydrogenase/5,10-methenyltetrahydrofolate cyclohydrolase [bacterium]
MRKIDGNEISNLMLEELKPDIDRIKPSIAALYAGSDPSTISYIKSKIKKGEKFGIKITLVNMDSNVSEDDFLSRIDELSSDSSIDGIIVEKPLPAHLNIKKAAAKISPSKDIDCLSFQNNGRLITDDFIIAPSTAMAVINILRRAGIDYEGKHAVIIGRSEIVGKPLSMLLLSKQTGNATVTVLHSKSINPEEETRRADIIIAAIGKANFLKRSYIGSNSPVLIDVGINYYNGSLTGDIDKECYELSSAYTPVPGGVGPVTVATLFENLIKLKKNYA